LYIETKYQFGDYVLWFSGELSKHIPLNFKSNGLDLVGFNIIYLILLMIIDKFGFNPVLININKLKPYWFIEDNTFQPILFKTNDLVPEKLVETNRSLTCLMRN
jgi:hypothetical protein